MSLRPATPDSRRSSHSLAVELAVVVALLAGVFLWRRVVAELQSALLGPPGGAGGLLLGGLLTGTLLVAGLALFATLYTTRRDVTVGTAVPAGADSVTLAVAAAVPPALVALTKLLGALTGVPYNALNMTAYGRSAGLADVLPLLALGLVVTVPSLVIVSQVLVQATLRRVAGGAPAVALTTGLTGVLLTSSTGGLTAVPDRGELAAAVAFALALALAVVTADRFDRRWARALGAVPALAVVALVVGSAVVEMGSLAGLVYRLTLVAVLGVAAVTYERTDSLLPPALAYLTFLLADRLVVYVFEAGLRSW